MSNSFEDLEVWQMGKNIVIETYQISTHFPREESFTLASQIKRAALSVPANIAEGFGRYHYLDKAKFYLNARGSLYELKSHLLIAQELGYFNQSQPITSLLITIDKLGVKLNNLISSTRKLNKKAQ
ncbi:MAG: four helix bundle protein [Chloroflexi bacterium]|nr:four helix bundle protein [Chloroflexota bacterium]